MKDEKNKKGLGRGLMSLFGDQDEESLKKNSDISNKLISIGDLNRSRFQPRTVFNDDKINELAESIKQNGLIQPIAVRPDSKDGKYEIVAGERRWLAAQRAGLHKIPVVILNLNDNQSLEVAIVENIQREDLNSIEEAKGYKKLMSDYNYNHDKLSKFMGKSRSHISNTVRLLTLPLEVVEMIEGGKLSAGQARPLVGMHNALELAKTILANKLSSRSVEKLIKIDKAKGANISQVDSNILSIQKEIEHLIGLKVNIVNKKNNSGRIIVEYKSLDQFELVSNLLRKK
jgi:ParB family chromosome partitioning protein